MGRKRVAVSVNDFVRRAMEDSQRYAVEGEPGPTMIHAAPIAVELFRQTTGVQMPLPHRLYAVVIHGFFAGSGGIPALSPTGTPFAFSYLVYVYDQATGSLIFKSVSPHGAGLREVLNDPHLPALPSSSSDLRSR